MSQPSPWDTECFSAWTDTNYTAYTEDIDWPYTFMVTKNTPYLGITDHQMEHHFVTRHTPVAMQEILPV